MKKSKVIIICCSIFLALVGFGFLFLITSKSNVKIMESQDMLEVGSVASDFSLENLKSEKISLASFKDKKSIILLFWYIGCPFCREQIEILGKDYSSLRAKDIEVLAVDVGDSKSRVSRFVTENSIDFPVLLDRDQAVAELYAVEGVPTYILVDKNGKIQYRDHRFPKNYTELLNK